MGTAINDIGSWEVRKAKLKLRYPFLTDNDLLLDEKNRIEMFGNLKSKLNLTTEELHSVIISL